MEESNKTLMQITEASQAFYKWEEKSKLTNLSDDDRLMFMAGYLEGKGDQTHDK